MYIVFIAFIHFNTKEKENSIVDSRHSFLNRAHWNFVCVPFRFVCLSCYRADPGFSYTHEFSQSKPQSAIHFLFSLAFHFFCINLSSFSAALAIEKRILHSRIHVARAGCQCIDARKMDKKLIVKNVYLWSNMFFYSPPKVNLKCSREFIAQSLQNSHSSTLSQYTTYPHTCVCINIFYIIISIIYGAMTYIFDFSSNSNNYSSSNSINEKIFHPKCMHLRIYFFCSFSPSPYMEIWIFLSFDWIHRHTH